MGVVRAVQRFRLLRGQVTDLCVCGTIFGSLATAEDRDACASVHVLADEPEIDAVRIRLPVAEAREIARDLRSQFTVGVTVALDGTASLYCRPRHATRIGG